MLSHRYSFVDSLAEAADCDGHGTHVSATIAGRAVGVAKDAVVVAVKVLDCQGRGTVSAVVAGLNWVAQHATRPAIVTMSLVGCVKEPSNKRVHNTMYQGEQTLLCSNRHFCPELHVAVIWNHNL